MKEYVKVLIHKEKPEYGYIVKRLNAQAYQIWTESEEELILSPSEFTEISEFKKGKDE